MHACRVYSFMFLSSKWNLLFTGSLISGPHSEYSKQWYYDMYFLIKTVVCCNMFCSMWCMIVSDYVFTMYHTKEMTEWFISESVRGVLVYPQPLPGANMRSRKLSMVCLSRRWGHCKVCFRFNIISKSQVNFLMKLFKACYCLWLVGFLCLYASWVLNLKRL